MNVDELRRREELNEPDKLCRKIEKLSERDAKVLLVRIGTIVARYSMREEWTDALEEIRRVAEDMVRGK